MWIIVVIALFAGFIEFLNLLAFGVDPDSVFG
jgi:hypothetical protein